jgi:acid phosphatase
VYCLFSFLRYSTVVLHILLTTSLRMLSYLALLPAAYAWQQRPLYSDYTFNPLEHLAGIAPNFEPNDPPRDPMPPQGCSVTQAAYLVRHAAINANSFDYETYLEPFVEKLANTSVDWSKIPELNFLDAWKAPEIEEESLLTRTGRLEASHLGVQMSYRYQNLKLPKNVWTSTAERTVVSAKSFVRGIEEEEDQIKVVEIYEGEESGADSLTPYKACPAYSGSIGSDQSKEYVEKYTKPIIARLHAQAPGFNWTSADVVGMFQWCGYDTVVRGSSPFCSENLFRPDEWLQFEYGQDLMYHFNSGYGAQYSGAVGYPWVNSTMNLLTTDRKDGDEDIYVSFTHRELPPMVLVALGLYNNSALTGANDINATMPLDRVNYGRQWRSSRILPFLGNIAIERMDCSDAYGYQTNGTDNNEFYRVLVNRVPLTLPDCYDGPQESCSKEMMQGYVRERAAVVGEFGEVCKVDYQNSTDILNIYTRDTNGTTVSK